MIRKKVFCILCSLILLSGFSLITNGQNVPYRLSDKQVEGLIKQLKKDTERFRKSLESSLDRSRLDGTNREDDINDFLKDYEESTERLYDRFKDHKSVSGDVEAVLDGAVPIDRFMMRHAPAGRAERDWEAVRQDLRRLAEAYNVTWRWW
jgi:hypothetical protein